VYNVTKICKMLQKFIDESVQHMRKMDWEKRVGHALGVGDGGHARDALKVADEGGEVDGHGRTGVRGLRLKC